MTIIIGLLGAAGAGKSTAANYLVEKYGAKRYSLAAPLKEITRRVLAFTDEQLFGSQAQKEAVDKRYGFSPRWFLQKLGTEGIRGVFGEDVWVDLLLKQIAAERPDVACIEDVRFKNESEKLRNYNYTSILPDNMTGTSIEFNLMNFSGRLVSSRGVVWRLENPHRDSLADVNHASEAEWREAAFDHLIAPMDLAGLYTLIDDAARKYNLFPVRRELPLL